MTDFYVMQIKELVKMGDLLNYYGFEIGKGNRIACPFHNGEDKNLGFKLTNLTKRNLCNMILI